MDIKERRLRVSISGKKIIAAVLIAAMPLWAIAFWYMRNPVFSKAEVTTSHVNVDPARLEAHVRFLAGLQPNRSFMHTDSLAKAEKYIVDQFKEIGFANVELQDVFADGKTYHNVIVRTGDEKAKDLIVIGAHYDAAGENNPGADDNASGVAVLLELARVFKAERPELKYPVEFVAYTLEEPPFFGGKEMGSVYHADRLKERGQNVVLMLSLETLGYFSNKLFSQGFSIPLLYGFYPWAGNFIGIVGAPADRPIQANFKAAMSANTNVSTLSITAPAIVPGIDYSDHRSYWAHDWPAFMITDTAFLRNDQYHEAGDTPERLDYFKMAEVARGVYGGILAIGK
jgi:Zn-dependent M28 family amino/carboxypeptidase